MGRGPVRINTYDQRTRPQGRDTPYVRPVELDQSLGRGLQTVARAVSAEAEAMQARDEDDARIYVSTAMANARARANEIRRTALTEAPDGWRGATERVSQEWGQMREEMIAAAPTPAAQRYLLASFDSYQPLMLEEVAEAEFGARQQWRVDSLESARNVESAAIAENPALFGQALGQRRALIESITDLDANQRRDLLDRDTQEFATVAVSAMIQRDPHAALSLLRGGGGSAQANADQIAALLGGSITSTQRTPEHNAEVGGVANSMHISGEAVDITVPERYQGMSRADIEADVAAQLDQAGIPASEIVFEGDHIHVGWRGVTAPERERGPNDPISHLTGPQLLTLTNQAEAEVNRRDSQWRSGVSQSRQMAETLWELGQNAPDAPSVETVRQAEGDIAALRYEAQREASAQYGTIAGLTNQELTALVADTNPRTGAREAVVHGARRQAAAQALEQRAQDPMGYLVRNRLVQEADLVGAINSQDWGLVNGILQMRSAAARTNAERLGFGEDQRPLTAMEAGTLGQYLRNLPAQSRGQFMRNAAAWMGGGSYAYQSMARQLFPDSPGNAYAGYLMGVAGEQGAADADIIMRGEALLGGRGNEAEGGSDRSRLLNMPEDDDLRRHWQDYVGDAYAGFDEDQLGNRPAEAMSYEVYRMAYAGLLERSPGSGDRINEQLARRAAQIASGGIIQWRGRETLMPAGMTVQQFERSVRAASFAVIGGDNPRNYNLVPLGQTEHGVRYLMLDGDLPVRTLGGAPAEIEVRRR